MPATLLDKPDTTQPTLGPGTSASPEQNGVNGRLLALSFLQDNNPDRPKTLPQEEAVLKIRDLLHNIDLLVPPDISSTPIDAASQRDFQEYLRTALADLQTIKYTDLLKSFGTWSRINGGDDTALLSQIAFNDLAHKLRLGDFQNLGSKGIGGDKSGQTSKDLNQGPDATFTRHPDFLAFLEKRGRENGHALTWNEIKSLAAEWNEAHKNQPYSHVTINPTEFLKLALRNPYLKMDAQGNLIGDPTISPTSLQYFLTGKMPSGLDSDQKELLKNGDLRLWKAYWSYLNLPFSYQAFQDSVNYGYNCVQTLPGQERQGRDFMEMSDAMRLLARRAGLNSAFRATITNEQAEQHNNGEDYKPAGQLYWEVKQRRIAARLQHDDEIIAKWKETHGGKEPSSEERAHVLLGAEWDELLKKLGLVPAEVYQHLTGLSREDAPYAYAALDFLGGFLLAGPAGLGKQALVGFSDPIRYLRDVIMNFPETAVGFLQSLNFFDPSISGPERFKRMLSAVGAIAALKGTGIMEGLGKESVAVRNAFRDAMQEVTPIKVQGPRRSQAGAVFPKIQEIPLGEKIRYRAELVQKLKEKLPSLSFEDARALKRQIERIEKETKVLRNQEITGERWDPRKPHTIASFRDKDTQALASGQTVEVYKAEILQRAHDQIMLLNKVKTFADLKSLPPGWNFEKMSGYVKDYGKIGPNEAAYSVRVDGQYRLVFKIGYKDGKMQIYDVKLCDYH